MKKSLVALAVLAASGAAMAQSSVTLYGLADVWVGNAKFDKGTGVVAPTGAAAAAYAGTSQNLMQSGGVNQSRWGIKGSEDLGGGLNAIFNFEQGFTLDNGAAAGVQFSRAALVGFSSASLGTVKLGRMATPFYDADSMSDGVFASALSAATVAFRTASGSDTSFEKSNQTTRYDNSVRYDTPTVAGFTGAVHYGFTENKGLTFDKAGNAIDAGANYSLSVLYAGGPLSAQLAFQSQKTTDAVEAVKNTRLGAAYNFGVATLKASYGKAQNVGAVSGADAAEYQIGVDYPVSSALTLSANYANSKDNSTLDATEGKRVAYGIGAAYTLSKRTFLYGGYVNGKKSSNVSTDDATVKALAVGVQHRF